MIAKIDTSGINIELNDDIRKYIARKIGRLDKYIPKPIRNEAQAAARLRETGNRLGNKYECEVVLKVSGATMQAKESTLNMFAAVDIAEVKLRNQLIKYKNEYRKDHPGLLRRLKSRVS